MTDTIVLGLNHKTAAIEVREKFFLNPTQQDLLLSELKSNPSVMEALVLSTCNRTEVYVHGLDVHNLLEPLISLIAQIKKIESPAEWKRHFYVYEGQEMIRHLFRVGCGLDSLVLGEKQILGQVKTAIERARQKGMFSRRFNILSNVVIRTAKKAQNETEISYGGSSVGWAAIAMAERLLMSLQGKSILIIGAGKMGELALSQIRSKGVKNIYLINRTESTAQSLAQSCGGVAVSFCDIKETLSEVDLCVCSAGAPHYILDKKTIEKVMRLRHNRTLTLIDISMPRNIDPQVAGVEGVFLSHLDDLDKVVRKNMTKRESAIQDVERLIEYQLTEFYKKLDKSENWDVEDSYGSPAGKPAGLF